MPFHQCYLTHFAVTDVSAWQLTASLNNTPHTPSTVPPPRTYTTAVGCVALLLVRRPAALSRWHCSPQPLLPSAEMASLTVGHGGFLLSLCQFIPAFHAVSSEVLSVSSDQENKLGSAHRASSLTKLACLGTCR